jgi:hypothetical protein
MVRSVIGRYGVSPARPGGPPGGRAQNRGMTISVDFDVPVHDYTKGWQDGSIYGHETPGAFDALRALMAMDAVFILTTRPTAPAAAWLADRGGFETLADDGTLGLEFWNRRGVLLVTNRKYPAHAYVDDRAVPFTGDWEAAIAAVAALAPVVRGPAGRSRSALNGEK